MTDVARLMLGQKQADAWYNSSKEVMHACVEHIFLYPGMFDDEEELSKNPFTDERDMFDLTQFIRLETALPTAKAMQEKPVRGPVQLSLGVSNVDTLEVAKCHGQSKPVLAFLYFSVLGRAGESCAERS